MLRANQRIKISCGARGQVLGRVEEVRQLAEVSAGLRAEVRARFLEWGVSWVASISYHSSARSQYMLTAIEIDGVWFDLDRRPLEIEVIGLHECDVASRS